MALDEPKENDKVYDNDSLKFLIEESLLETCGSIKLEYIEAGPRSGFGITSTNPRGPPPRPMAQMESGAQTLTTQKITFYISLNNNPLKLLCVKILTQRSAKLTFFLHKHIKDSYYFT